VRILRVVEVIGLLALLVAAIVVFVLAGEPSMTAVVVSVAAFWEGESNLWVRAVAVLAAIVAIGLLIRIGYAYQWTGFGEEELREPENRDVRPRKTLWDWLQLGATLTIPIASAIFGAWFTTQQDDRQRAVEEHRARDTALQAYLDQMSTLLLKEDLSDDNVRILLRARTLTVLGSLDPNRKAQVMHFLEEAELVQQVDERDRAISLAGADLSGADLSDSNLSGADLFNANLRDSDLSDANLSEADLRGVDLKGAELGYANLSGANLSGANLSGAGLYKTDLSGATLILTTLVNANLSNSNLSGANLFNADLRNAEGVTQKQLEQRAKTLEGATMPDGSKAP
jgi:uncharacterized protein YjbI with pentapeptide repeats